MSDIYKKLRHWHRTLKIMARETDVQCCCCCWCNGKILLRTFCRSLILTFIIFIPIAALGALIGLVINAVYETEGCDPLVDRRITSSDKVRITFWSKIENITITHAHTQHNAHIHTIWPTLAKVNWFDIVLNGGILKLLFVVFRLFLFS